MNKAKLFIGILLIFIVGALAGSLATQKYVKYRITQFHKGGPPIAFYMRYLSHKLDLRDDQKITIEKIMEESVQQTKQLSNRFIPKMDEIVDNTFTQVEKELNPEQREKLKELREHMKNRRSHRWIPPRPRNRLHNRQ